MSEFGKKLIALAVVSLIMFAAMAGITYLKVQNYDAGEVIQNSLQALVAGLAILVANAARSIFAVVVISLSLVTQADAGLLNFFRLSRNVQSACANGQCNIKPLPAKPSGTKPIAKYRYECGPNGCRLVPVK